MTSIIQTTDINLGNGLLSNEIGRAGQDFLDNQLSESAEKSTTKARPHKNAPLQADLSLEANDFSRVDVNWFD
jgi:hypothetical protein